MKKVTKRKGNTMIQGASCYDGITFIVSKNFLGPFVVNGPSVRTTILEGKPFYEITKEFGDIQIQKDLNVMGRIVRDIASKLFFACFILIAISTGTYLTKVFQSFIFILIAISVEPEIFAIFVNAKIFRKKKFIDLMRYHGAEHAAINAFYDLGIVPSIDEIKKYSRFSLKCGSLSGLYKIAGWCVPAIAVLFPNYWCTLLVAVILYILLIIMYNKEKLYFMEFMVTSNPTDSEYEVAIEGLTKVLDEYKKMENSSFTHLPIEKGIGFMIIHVNKE